MKKSLVFGLLFFVAVAGMDAQVTIGSADNPTDGAVLDLSKSVNLGLMLPHVVLNNATHYQLGTQVAADTYPAGAGTVVYNTGGAGALAKGLYIWDGNNWLAVDGTITADGPGTMTDARDGKSYKINTFGTAGTWMVENLAYKPTASDISTIQHAPNVSGNTNTPYYYEPNGMSEADAISTSYLGSDGSAGFLYSWAAAMKLNDGAVTTGEGSQGICPAGWHLPTDAEWTALEAEIAANPSKYSSSTGTLSTGNSGTAFKSTTQVPGSAFTLSDATSKNSADGGFNALLVGYAYSGSTAAWGGFVFYWSSSSADPANAFCRYLGYNTTNLTANAYAKYQLYSVRCVK